MQEKIVFLDGLSLGEHDLQEKLLQKLPNANYTEYPTTSKEQTLERAKGATIVLSNKVVLDKEALGILKDTLKLICITATGMNNVDLDAAKEYGIAVKNVAGYSTKSVAQHTLMMALALSAKLPLYDSFCKSGEYARNPLFTNLSTPLRLISGKKWGIIGLGSIGQEVAKLATAFGAEVCYHSTSGKNLNAPYPLIQEGAILINVGRGGIVNEEDLAKELKKREIYVGFDVFTQEPIPQNHPFLDKGIANQLLLTPHNAWGYEESKEILIQGVIDNIAQFVQ